MSGPAAEGPARELARLLARRLRERDGPAAAPVTVAELRRELLPYPRVREPVGLASKAEYDLAMLDLLAEPAALAIEDPELAEAVERERGAAEPGLGFLEDFAAATLHPGSALTAGEDEGRPAEEKPGPDPDPASAPEAGAASSPEAEAASSPEARRGTRSGGSRSGGSRPDGSRSGDARSDGSRPDDARPGASPAEGPDAAGSCRDCGRELPGREGLRYCPWCGTDQRVPRCDACRERLEPDWSYCPGCGAAADG